jgi:glycosyltransferase involved in cell wall biosynthesis
MDSVEVIVPCYKYGHFLRQCVQSLLTQSWGALSIVIINDASPDDTAEIADSLASEDARVSVIHHGQNLGHIASYNEALARTAADYTLILSADDLLTPGAIERAVLALSRIPGAGLCFGDDIPFESGALLPPRRALPSEVPTAFEEYSSFLLRSCRLGHTAIQAPTAIMRTSVQRAVGGFLRELPHSGDTEIWLRIAAEGGVVRVDAEQAYRRLHTKNMSLEYPALGRLREQQRAFQTHFDYMGDRLRNSEEARNILLQQLGESALWIASRAFEEGNPSLAEEARLYALAVCPAIRSSASFRRFRLKQAAGKTLWNLLHPLLRRCRAAGADLALPR